MNLGALSLCFHTVSIIVHFVAAIAMFGISDHDLMFERQAAKIAEGEGAVEDDGNNFIQEKVSGWLLAFERRSLEHV